jgi:hypothetical protein
MRVKDVCPHPISAQWEDSDGPQSRGVFPQFSVVPSVARLPLNLKSSTDVSFFDRQKIGTAKVTKEETEEPKQIFLEITLTQSSTIEIAKAVSDDQIEFEVKFTREIGLNPECIAQFQAEEDILTLRDSREIAIDNVRNELESLIFEIEAFLRESPDCFNPDQLGAAQELTQRARDWFTEHEFDRLQIGEYRRRISELRGAAGEAIERQRAIRQLFDCAGPITARIGQLTTKIDALPADAVKQIRTELTDILVKLRADTDLAQQTPFMVNPTPSIQAVSDRIGALEAAVQELEEEMARKKAKKRCNVA